MTASRATASVRAITDLEVIEMDREGFTRLFKEHPDAAAGIGDIIAARNRDRLEKLASGVDHGRQGRAASMAARQDARVVRLLSAPER